MSHHDDDWDTILAFLLLGEGRGWALFLSTVAVVLLVIYHYWW